MDITENLPEKIVVGKEEHAYGFIIEVLTQGLYPNKFHAIREYIQNSFDAIIDWRKTSNTSDYGHINVKISAPSIFIYDDGIGMNRAKINQYRYVGYSEKLTSEGVGFRGIGKLSGISVAEKLIITTSPYGEAKRYKLIFDADAMLDHILTLKVHGQNISLNDLIKKYTNLTEEEDDADKHYTLVELYNVKKDSLFLMNNEKLSEYLSSTIPIQFDPNFPYGKTIDTWLRDNVNDYDTVPVSVNDALLYKPFLTDLKPPLCGFVWDGDNDVDDDHYTNQESKEPIAFYWYCEHATKGQFPDENLRGLIYRIKNFAIGTNQLPRITLWKSSPERSFYFFGEIHIIDPDIVPSSSRDDFEQNDARERLYRSGSQISKTLNQLAGTSSSQRRAKEFIEKAEETVQTIQRESSTGQIPRELQFNTMFNVQTAILEVSKRKNDAPELGERADNVIEAGEKLIKEIQKVEADGSSPAIYDITTQIKLGDEGNQVYLTIIESLKDEFGEQSETYERIIRRIHADLKKKWILGS
jgi:hypothetical protein